MEEFVAMLMRLRLGLLLEEVADRFAISPATMSKIFLTWIKVMSKAMKVIFPWPSREQVRKNVHLCPYNKVTPLASHDCHFCLHLIVIVTAPFQFECILKFLPKRTAGNKSVLYPLVADCMYMLFFSIEYGQFTFVFVLTMIQY